MSEAKVTFLAAGVDGVDLEAPAGRSRDAEALVGYSSMVPINSGRARLLDSNYDFVGVVLACLWSYAGKYLSPPRLHVYVSAEPQHEQSSILGLDSD